MAYEYNMNKKIQFLLEMEIVSNNNTSIFILLKMSPLFKYILGFSDGPSRSRALRPAHHRQTPVLFS